MEYNYLLYLFAYLVTGTIAREAIVNGYSDKLLSFPYFVSITIPGKGHVCGGCIIGDELILTAASCLIANDGKLIAKPIFIHAGTNDLHRAGEVVQVQKIIVSKHYRHIGVVALQSDLAILKLTKSLDLSNNMYLMKLRLPRGGYRLINKTAIFAGFGWHWLEIRDDKQYGGQYDSLIRYSNVDILSSQQCEHQHPRLPNFQQNYLCASLKQHDASRPSGACLGDGGGPLVWNNKYVVGILSLNKIDCSENDSSSVYTRVSSHQKFINEAMNNITTNMLAYNV